MMPVLLVGSGMPVLGGGTRRYRPVPRRYSAIRARYSARWYPGGSPPLGGARSTGWYFWGESTRGRVQAPVPLMMEKQGIATKSPGEGEASSFFHHRGWWVAAAPTPGRSNPTAGNPGPCGVVWGAPVGWVGGSGRGRAPRPGKRP